MVSTKKRKSRRKYRGYGFKRTYTGTVSLYRHVDCEMVCYGGYPDEETAMMVAELLSESDWSDSVAYECIRDYAVPGSRRIMLKRFK